MADLTIRCRPNGPLVVEGPGLLDGALRIIDHEGNPFPIPTHKPAVALCRCGHSAIKPFCDGAHKTCGFQAEELAPR